MLDPIFMEPEKIFLMHKEKRNLFLRELARKYKKVHPTDHYNEKNEDEDISWNNS